MAGRHIVTTLVLAATLALMPAPAQSAQPIVGPQPAPLVFAGDMSYAPIESLHRGNPEGLNVDIVRELGKRMGTGVDIRLMDWPEAQQQVLYGEADALMLMAYSEERAKLYDFSAPTLELQFSLFTRDDDLTINALHDLKGKTVALIRGDYPRHIIEPMEGVSAVFVDNNLQGFKLLKGGDADVLAANKWVGTYTLQEHNIEGIRVLQKPFATKNAAIAVKKGNAALLGRINNAIKTMRADGTIAGIVQQWSPQKVLFLTQERLQHIKYAAAGFMLALVVSGGGLWAYSLRGQVRRRTKAIETVRAEMEHRVQERTRELTEAIKVHESTEEALSASEEKYRSIFETAGNLITSVDADGTIVECNSRMKDLLGYERHEIIGQKMDTIIHPDSHARAMESLEQIIATGSSYNKVYKMMHKDGSLVDVSINSAGLFDTDGEFKCTICIIDDITERKLLEEERLRSQKLESLGVLAGGIAHDFNNLLTGVFGNLSLAKHFINSDDKAMGRIKASEEALKRAKGLTYQLLTFARGGEPIKKAISIAELLKNSVRFSLSGSNVKCAFNVSGDLCNVQADEGQISQVLQNIVLNAQQAMPEGGELLVSATNIVSDGEDAMLPVGRYVRLSISDHGIGIPEEHLSRIFDPYYTTKQKGSGLGLASAYSIVNKHNGIITVQSELGQGTTFHIHLPALCERSSIAEEAQEEMVTGHGRVLVMDDESIVLEVAREMLNAIGYEVGTSRNGQDAVELYQRARESGEPFDAVIMDLTVPGGMGGREAIKRILAMDPGARAIVSSGYSEDPIMTSFREYGFAGVIKKPYRLDEVSRTLNDVINYTASGTA